MDIEHFGTKLADFIVRLEREMNEEIVKRYPILQENALTAGRRGYEEVQGQRGRRFMKIVAYNGTQTMVKYFVERSTGIIFGAKSFKVYNPNHEYGTLDTLDQYEWGGYYAMRKDGKTTLVPAGERK